jgi:transposase-like protein
MGRKPKQQRSAEEKLAIVMEGLKSGNIAETCRKFEIAPNLFYRWKDEVEKGALAELGGGAQPRGPKRSG